ncbi:hypothetical protein FIBSPDRAFT_881151 [Athelia psychrophila]|uniref:Uncharacterized protein n=1 Tax=Athelia psychrophila TaxID=1759441 RepID=A0A166XCR7_9AGAM|nr:hypothetical protein FIBSPDRAFT_881151 [Fibularhizoctonia sp. CBS 109695]
MYAYERPCRVYWVVAAKSTPVGRTTLHIPPRPSIFATRGRYQGPDRPHQRRDRELFKIKHQDHLQDAREALPRVLGGSRLERPKMDDDLQDSSRSKFLVNPQDRTSRSIARIRRHWLALGLRSCIKIWTEAALVGAWRSLGDLQLSRFEDVKITEDRTYEAIQGHLGNIRSAQPTRRHWKLSTYERPCRVLLGGSYQERLSWGDDRQTSRLLKNTTGSRVAVQATFQGYDIKTALQDLDQGLTG